METNKMWVTGGAMLFSAFVLNFLGHSDAAVTLSGLGTAIVITAMVMEWMK